MAKRTDDIEFLLSRHIDGQLDPRRAGKLDRLLADDADLREQLRLYRLVDDAVRQAGRPLPDDIDYDEQREDIIVAVERKVLADGLPHHRLVLRPAFGLLAAAAMVLAAASVALLIYRSGPAPPGSPFGSPFGSSPGSSSGPGGPAVPQIEVAVVSLAPVAASDRQLSVSLRRPDQPSPPVQVPPGPARPLPAGTIIASVSAEQDTAGASGLAIFGM